MNIDKLFPVAGSHAVQNAAFIIEWAEPLSSDVLLSAMKLATKFRNLDLPYYVPQNSIEVKLDGLANSVGESVGHGKAKMSGVLFSRDPVQPGVMSRQVTFSRQHCIILVPDYHGWDIVFSEVKAYLKVLLAEVGPLRPIKTIGLQYTNLFQWKDDPSDLDFSKVFLDDFFIPRHALNQKGLWHLHHGYIENHQNPVPYSVLENINVDIGDVSGERAIQIVASHRATLNDPIWKSQAANQDKVFEIFDNLHASNKLMLQRLLAAEVSAKIGLNGR